MSTTPVLVGTLEACQEAVAELLLEREIAIDIEGVDLSRAGKVCLIQMCGSTTRKVFLFDIHVLQQDAFEEGGLKKLLEAEHVTKLFYDVRADNDALHHLHAVKVRGAYDLQVLWHVRFQHPTDRYLQGLKKVLAQYLEQSKVVTPKEASALDLLKEKVQKLFVPELGGSYEVWMERPFRPELLLYAAADVKFLLGMRRFWVPKDAELAEDLDRFVREASAIRLKKFVELPDAEALNYSNKKFREFEIPDGYNQTGDIMERISLPAGRVGRVIGKGGATIKAIQESTKARVSIDGSIATIVGQSNQVQAAARQIRAKIA